MDDSANDHRRCVRVGAAQLGPVHRDEDRSSVVERLVVLLHDASDRGCDLVVYPELALTTFFPRWFVDDIAEADHWYETSMPNEHTQPLFDEAERLGVGFCLGYALHERDVGDGSNAPPRMSWPRRPKPSQRHTATTTSDCCCCCEP